MSATREDLVGALERIKERYRRQTDRWRPGREWPNEYGRGWHDGYVTALAECSIDAGRGLDPEAHAENEHQWRVAAHGSDADWYAETGYCGRCAMLADSCDCKGECGCWEEHGPPPEPYESPMDRVVRERNEARAELEALRGAA